MQCPACQHQNEAIALFCEECGNKLYRQCASCGTDLKPTAKFCLKCGAATNAAPPTVTGIHETGSPDRRVADYTPKHLADKILRAKSALEGERKQLTVLFADVKGSMTLAEQLDPEIWHEILDRFFGILAEGIHRFEGTINQYTGDGIMALFGAPIAHEDHAQRACYAALHLREQLRHYADTLRVDPGVNFSFRIGLNSGEVVVGKIGDDLRMDYTAQGHTVGLAQRMEQLAPADGIAVSENTHNAVAGFFTARGLGPMRVKGAGEPIEVFVLESASLHRTRLDTARARGLSRFVGRGDETHTLESALQHALTGTGRVAAVVGEPGVGKSRLCVEFIERCRGAGLKVYEAHCPAHGKSIPYLPLLELLRNLFGITEEDNPATARQRISASPGGRDDSPEDLALVFDFLGVADPDAPVLQFSPDVRQRRLFAFMRRLIQRRAETEPVVLLIDDLHWIDPGSDLFVAQIVEAVSTTRTLLLANFRPEYSADWLRKSWVLQLPMAPLSSQPLAELVLDWIGPSPSVARLPGQIAERTGGNPFFAEEIVLSLIETGRLVGTRGAYELTTRMDTLDVPATVQALLAARIDRLGEREKQALYTAAVIGKEFARPLLEAVVQMATAEVDAGLSALRDAEMIIERAIYPVAEYSFKHPLTHNVALHAQLAHTRRGCHAKVAEVLTETTRDRHDEYAALIAHHWSEAGEAQRAATWQVRAARWVSVTDFGASRRHWQEARRLLLASPDSSDRSRLLLEVYPELLNCSDLLGTEAADAASVFAEASALARDAGDLRTEALLEAVYSNVISAQSDFDNMIRHTTRAVTVADASGDRALRIFARYFLGRALVWLGRWHEGIAVYDEAAAIGESDAAAAIEVLRYRPYIECLAIRANALAVTGRPHDAFDFVERFDTLRRIAGAGADLSSAAADRFWPCLILANANRALQCADEALQIAERYGGERGLVYALLAGGGSRVLAGRWAEGNALLERAQQRIAATGAGAEWSTPIDAFQALCLAHLGERERSLELLRRAEQRPDTALRFTVGFVRARAMRVAGGLDLEAGIHAEIALALHNAEQRRSSSLEPLLLLERAGLARLRGDAVGMANDLAAALRLITAFGMTGWESYARSIAA